MSLILLSNTPPAAAESVILHLHNGDRITGALVAENEEEISVLVYGSRVTIPLAAVERREPVPAPVPVVEPEPSPVEPPVVVPAPEPPPPKRERRWRGDAQAGMDVGISEVNRQIYHARLRATYVRAPFRNTFDYTAAYGFTDRVLSANRMDGSSKTEFDIIDRFFVYSLMGGGYDEIRKIRLRYEAGPGVGYHFIRRPTFVLSGEVGMNYQAQHRTDGRDVQRFYYRLAEELTWQITDRLTFDEKLEFFPQAENLETFRIRFESNVSYELRKNLFLNLTVLNLYDTDTVSGIPKNDLQIRSSVGVKF